MADKERLIVEHLPLVRSIAIGVHESHPRYLDFDDMMQAGSIGLMKAADKFDPAVGATFRGYARRKIHGEILDNLRALDWSSRDVRMNRRKVEAAKKILRTELAREPYDDEVAQRMGIRLKQFRKMMLDISVLEPVSMAESRDFTIVRSVAQDPEDKAAQSQLSATVQTVLRGLDPRRRKVVEAYYLREKLMREIGIEHKVSECRISLLIKESLGKLRSMLQDMGIHSSRDLLP